MTVILLVFFYWLVASMKFWHPNFSMFLYLSIFSSARSPDQLLCSFLTFSLWMSSLLPFMRCPYHHFLWYPAFAHSTQHTILFPLYFFSFVECCFLLLFCLSVLFLTLSNMALLHQENPFPLLLNVSSWQLPIFCSTLYHGLVELSVSLLIASSYNIPFRVNNTFLTFLIHSSTSVWYSPCLLILAPMYVPWELAIIFSSRTKRIICYIKHIVR